VEVELVPLSGTSAVNSGETAHTNQPIKITLPWAAASFAAVKGIVPAPDLNAAMKPESRDAPAGSLNRSL
jgi:hypothetical protein